MQVALFVALLDELISEDVDLVVLGGSEPTLHPALPVLLDAVRKRGLRAGLNTKAREPGQVMALADISDGRSLLLRRLSFQVRRAFEPFQKKPFLQHSQPSHDRITPRSYSLKTGKKAPPWPIWPQASESPG